MLIDLLDIPAHQGGGPQQVHDDQARGERGKAGKIGGMRLGSADPREWRLSLRGR